MADALAHMAASLPLRMPFTDLPWYLLQFACLIGIAGALAVMTALLGRDRSTRGMAWFSVFSVMAMGILIVDFGVYAGAPWGPNGFGCRLQGIFAVALVSVYLQYQRAICARPLPGAQALLILNVLFIIPAVALPGSLWFAHLPDWIPWAGPHGEQLHRYDNLTPASLWYPLWAAAACSTAVWGIVSAWRTGTTMVLTALLTANSLMILSIIHDFLVDREHWNTIYTTDYVLLVAFVGQALVLMVDERRMALGVRRRESYYRTVVQSVPDGVLILDGSVISEANPQAVALLGAAREQVIGRTIADFLSAEGPPQSQPGRARATTTGTTYQQLLEQSHPGQPQRTRVRMQRLTGEVIVIDLSLCAFTLDHVRSSAVILHDVTQQIRMEEQLRQGQKMEAIGQLAGGVAHDFNNMLTGILASGELLRKKVQDERHLRLIDTIISAGERAATLTQKLVGFARRHDVAMQPVAIHAEIELAVDLLLRTIDRRIIIEKHLDAASCLVVGNAADIQNAFLNLFINARDAMPGGGRLTISTSITVLSQEMISALSVHWPLEPGPYIQTTVVDTGTGMDETVMRRAFEPFFTTKKVGHGTGLGLAGVYGMVREHHGSVQVFSTPGKGTRFVFLLPLLTTAQPPAVHAGSGSEGLVAGQPAVLLYGEDILLRDSVAEMLSSLGCRVLTASSEAEALTQLDRPPAAIDLVILDQYLSGAGVAELCRTIHRNAPQQRMVIMTNYSGDKSLVPTRADGHIATLIKPFTRRDLAMVVSASVQAGPRPGPGALPASS